MPSPEDREPFDETSAPRSRRRCFFCEADQSDEWKFLARMNAFVCKGCQAQIDARDSDGQETKNRA